MPTVTLLYFAGVAERLGRPSETLDFPRSTTTEAILATLADRHPPIAELLATCRLAVDQQFARGVVELHSGSELAVIPPVSGG